MVAPGPADSSLDSQSRIEDLDQALGEGQSNPTKTAPLDDCTVLSRAGHATVFLLCDKQQFFRDK